MKIFFYLAAALSMAVAFHGPAQAQLIDPLNVEPDANGVDMLTAQVSRPVPVLQVPGAPNLRLERLQLLLPVATGSESGIDPIQGSVQVNPGNGTSESFQCFERNCWPPLRSGSTLIMLGSGTQRVMTYMQAGTGVRIRFDSLVNRQDTGGTEDFAFHPSWIAYPNGETLTFDYDMDEEVPGVLVRHRPTRVTSNLGYEMHLSYASDTEGTSGWTTLQRATIYRTGDTTTALAQHDYSGGTITDLANRTWSCCADILYEPAQVSAVAQSLPGESGNSFEAIGSTNHSVFPRVAQIISDGVTWNYTATETTGTGKCTISGCDLEQIVITGPDNFERIVENNVDPNPSLATVVERVTNRPNATTTYTTHYEYDDQRRLTQITYPRGNAVEVEYDDFGNIVVRRERAVTYPSDLDLVQEALFDTPPDPPGPGFDFEVDNDCDDVRCYLPTRTRDAEGNWTDYIWGEHGGNIKTLEPEGDNGQRRLTHRFYSGGGTLTRLTSEEICGVPAAGTTIANATCANDADTQITNYTYWQNTFLPETVTRTSGAPGSLSAVTTYAYDNAGRMTMEDGPLPGTDDATYYRYDIVGRQIQVVGPQGASGSARAGTETVFRDADDQPLIVRNGYFDDAADQSLTILNELQNFYDDRRLVLLNKTIDGVSGHTLSAMEFTYSPRNQLICETLRMNPAEYNSLESGACNLDTEGTMGPDRIRRHFYDWMGRRFMTRGGFRVLNGGPGNDEYRLAFTDNGQIRWRRDGNGNQTTYTYDAYDRLERTTFPNGSYEELTYGDDRGLVTRMRTRTGRFINHAYDDAGRLTGTTYDSYVPGEAPVAYSYDGLGRETRIERIDPEGDAHDSALTVIAYDELGRMESSTQEGRQVSYQYDIAGRRTRLTWPDAFYVTYDYSPAGQVTAIRDDSGAELVGYDYDAGARLMRVDRSNGRDTAFLRDGLGRPTRWSVHVFTHIDLTYNPASQIVTRTLSDNNQVWDDYDEFDRGYLVNVLNQYTSTNTSSGTVNYSYDTNGNLTGDGTNTYVYDPENRLKWRDGPNGLHQLRYDGRGRLLRRWGNTLGRGEMLYDGDALIAEYADISGAMRERYVHGPGVDDPIVTYAGPSTAPGNREFLHADERGSIIGISDNAGIRQHRNTYDEWGIPANDQFGVTNVGRFQYTGQQYLPEIGLYYYRARFYSPTLGRFMQTDPIGYDDGMNMYAYVGNDPMNATDPSGERCALLNSGSPYCLRRDVYRYFDRQSAHRTRFFGAAAATVEYLANNDLPVLGNFISDQAEAFLREVSSALYRLNVRVFAAISDGTLSGPNLDRQLVRMEQAVVQSMIDALPSGDRAAIVGSINDAFSNSFRGVAGFTSDADARYNRILNRVEDDLGRDIDFGNQEDREAIGNALIRDLRRNGDCTPLGSNVPRC